MDKYELVLDIIEHPEKYTSEQLTEILSEPQTREIYNLLVKTRSAVDTYAAPDVDAEWMRFSSEHGERRTHRGFFLWTGSRAASIAAIICVSAVAVAAGIAVTFAVSEHRAATVAETANVKTEAIALAPAAEVTAAKGAEKVDTIVADMTPVMFENEPLETIMKKIADAYGVEVKFNNKEAAVLHLFYKFDPALPLGEVIEQLNTFEQINITRNGDTLNID